MATVARTRGRIIAGAPPARADPAMLTDRQLQALITSPQACCVGRSIDPDEWFPTSAKRAIARSEASHALALCASCPVRAECLELSLRHWHGVGRYGIWGGMLAPERRALRRQWLAGIRVSTLVSCAAAGGRSAVS
jgi:WhiB family transcriptional regulator, redox-sensing transcriptional regulator